MIDLISKSSPPLLNIVVFHDRSYLLHNCHRLLHVLPEANGIGHLRRVGHCQVSFFDLYSSSQVETSSQDQMRQFCNFGGEAKQEICWESVASLLQIKSGAMQITKRQINATELGNAKASLV